MKRYSKYLVPLFALSEMLAIGIAAYIAVFIRYGTESLPPTINETILFISVALWPLLSGATGYYRDRRTWSSIKSLAWLTFQWLIISFILFAYLVLTKADISRLTFTSFLILAYVLLFLSNRIRYLFLKKIRSRGMNQRSIIYVGLDNDYEQFSKWLQGNTSFGYHLINMVDAGMNNAMINPLKQLENLLASTRAEEILIGPFSGRRTLLTELVDIAEEQGCRVRIIQKKEDVCTRQIGLKPFGPFQVFSVREEPLSYLPAKLYKRAFDIIFSTAVLILIYWWLHLILMTLIKLTSPGPVFFRQKRVGRNGREFYCLKFRTMRANGSDCDGQGKITEKTDSRITPIGNFLRRSNLDELPQFINVLIGDMSVIGPRPHMLEEDYQVAKNLRKYRLRRFVRPGISGWAAVNGFRGGTQDMELMQKRVDYDIDYIESWTPWLDLKIIFLTIIQMLTGSTGAH